jgi:sec-independent protein translocase protein TatA
MPIHFGLPELLIILVVVILLFGVGRIGKIAGELGSGIRSFKKELKGDEDDEKEESSKENSEEKNESS